MKISFFKKEKIFQKKDFSFNADFYWEVSVFLALFMVLFSLIAGYYLFSETKKDFVFSAINSKSKVQKIDEQRMKNALNYFDEKDKKSIDIITSPSPIVDPSI